MSNLNVQGQIALGLRRQGQHHEDAGLHLAAAVMVLLREALIMAEDLPLPISQGKVQALRGEITTALHDLEKQQVLYISRSGAEQLRSLLPEALIAVLDAANALHRVTGQPCDVVGQALSKVDGGDA